MPEICRFDGIVITMNFNDHNTPHFYAEYTGMEAIFDLNQDVFIKGALPSRQSRLFLAWFELNKNELLNMWGTKEFKKIKSIC